MNGLYESAGFDPTVNLAIEEALLLSGAQVPALFLWQNAHTVVIGRGQNAWKECRVDALREAGGTLVRRTTGGGAVYHDLGNLNFSFVMPKTLYDIARQLGVIRRAVAAFGVEAEASGRNDIVLKASEAKFSGNAFRRTQQAALHHGTLLVDVDMENLGRFLAPSQAKLAAKGVQSVRARVENLAAHVPGITIPALKQALFDAFVQAYGPAEMRDWQTALDPALMAELTEKYRSWDWTFGTTPAFDITLMERFAWGQAELMLSLRRGVVTDARCYTDANDPELAERVAQALIGSPFTPQDLAARLGQAEGAEMQDLAQWLAEVRV